MVSIIIPVFNKKDTLVWCLNSILNNNYQDKEIIVVDDGSTDDSTEILKRYVKRGIRLIELSKTQGVAFVCNLALSKARGDIIIRTDADTVLPTDWIRRLTDYFQDPEVVAVGGATYGCLNPQSRISRICSQIVKLEETILKRPFIFGRLPGANRAIRRYFLEKIGGFSEENQGCEDRDLFFRLKKLGRIIFDPNIVVKTEFPSTLTKLWQRKFSWGEAEARYSKWLPSFRLYFSFFIVILSIGLILSNLIFFMVNLKLALILLYILIIGYSTFLFITYKISHKDEIKFLDIIYTPLVLFFSETAFFCGAMQEELKFNLFIKRLYDFCFSLFCMIVSLPLWFLISLAIYLEDGRPIFFSDSRVGKNRRVYRHLKFRSMIKNAEEKSGPIWSRQDDGRVTKIGMVLRATALDELPQLINILKGDMSFVGPRPERPYFVERFIKEVPNYEKRFSVKPGLTGMAQVYGEHDTPPEDKLRLDLEYIKNAHLLLELKIICFSFLVTFKAGWERFRER